MTGPLPPWPDRPALFLDFDGTLLELAPEPHLVRPSPELTALLPALRPATDDAVALVSGRRIEEIDRILAPHRFAAAGVHGLERRDAAGATLRMQVNERGLARVRAALAPFVAGHAGLLLEDKVRTIAIHYRRRPDLADEVRRVVASLEPLPPDLELLPGRMVFEIKPRAADKGRAIAAFTQEPPFRGRTPVFVGDDVTDEAGFAVVNALGGVTVKVSDGATAARFRLRGVRAVLDWLERAIAPASVRRSRSAR